MKKILFLSMHKGFGGAASANASIINMLSKYHQIFFIDEFYENTCRYFVSSDNIKCISYAIHKLRYKWWKINPILKKEKPDYLFILSPILIVYYLIPIIILKIEGVKIQLIFHSLPAHLSTSLFRTSVFKWLFAGCMWICNDVFFVSKFTQAEWMNFFLCRWNRKSKFHVIYNAISDSDILTKENKELINISFVGRLSHEKQPELFVKTAQQSSLKKYSFHIWGDGFLMDRLRGMNSNPKLLFHGFSSDSNVIYHNTDLLILTSHFENCPMVILESKIRGIPVIAPCIGGIPEIVTNYKSGILLPNPLDVNDIISAIFEISASYTEYSRECKKEASSFGNLNIVDDWLLFYK